MSSVVKRWLPIRKIVMTAVGAGLTWGAMRGGLDLGTDSMNEAATILVGLVFGFAEKDPKVVHVLDEVESIIDAATGDKPAVT